MSKPSKIHHIQVDVKTMYIAEQSDPNNNQYVFIYTVSIRNTGTTAAKLLSRHWIITDANGGIQEVQGIGVVGEQPYLKPGENFEYTSGTILNTPFGSMQGSYQLLADDGVHFDAVIPPFSLAAPHTLH